MKKTAQINIMISNETKLRLLQKAKALNLSLTNYIEKIANEPIIFLDENLKLVLSHIRLNSK